MLQPYSKNNKLSVLSALATDWLFILYVNGHRSSYIDNC